MIAKRLGLPFLLGLLLTGCANGGLNSIANATLEAVGVRQPPALPEVPDSMKPARQVSIRLHASDRLNLNADGQPLAIVARVYKLRQSAAFEHAPYGTFLNPQAEKEAFGADLVEVKEITLVPGQHYEVTEKVPREAGYLGVIALFNSPAPQRWRLTFPAADVERSGITVGVHACAFSVGSGAGAPNGELGKLSSVHCQHG
jgi:type VI secretion system protein VasD